MSSIRSVARLAGVSVATVSRVLSSPEKVSEKTLKKVQQAIEKVQYRPNMLARNFRATRSYSIVVLVPDISNPFFSVVISGIEDRAQQSGYAVLLGDTRDSPTREKEYFQLAENRLADGVIQLRPHSIGAMLPSDSNIAYVNACGCSDTPGPSVHIDNIGAAKTIVDYLVSMGHRRIGVISGRKDNPHTRDRMSGYKLSLQQAGIEFDETLIAEGDFTMWSGLDTANYFCKMKNKPTALFCMNDEMAIGAIQTLKNNKLRVPEDISVTGFDDIQYARYCDPPLSTIAQPARKIGEVAMETLLNLIDGKKPAHTDHVLPFEFVIRNSIAPAKKSA